MKLKPQILILSLLVMSRSLAFAQSEFKLVANDADRLDAFGWSVALDQDLAVISAPVNRAHGVRSGAVYIFRRVENGWQQEAKLSTEDPETGANFGFVVSVSENQVAVAAPFEDVQGHQDAGAVYLFKPTASGWQEEARLIAADVETEDHFGSSLAMMAGIIIVGAPSKDSAGFDSGAAYVFGRDGDRWVQEAKLVPDVGGTRDQFGFSVALAQDDAEGANFAVIGAPFEASQNRKGAGAVYVFKRTGTQWQQEGRITADDAEKGAQFGFSVAADRNTILVGAPFSDNQSEAYNLGSAFVFKNTTEGWQQQARLEAADAAPGDKFGWSAALQNDLLLLGTPFRDDAGSNSGAAYLFRNVNDTWEPFRKIMASDAEAGDCFGYSVAINTPSVLIGALYDDDNGRDSGSAYVFGSPDTPIPVELTLFTAQTMGDAVLLKWMTATETENLGFHILRSLNETGPYVRINEEIIAGQGNSSNSTSYLYIDRQVEMGRTYFYKLTDVDFFGNAKLHGPVSIHLATRPTKNILEQNNPNPFNPDTVIRFAIHEAGFVRLNIYNVQGELVRNLISEFKKSGEYAIQWNGKNEVNRLVPSGLYLYRLEVNDFDEVKRMLLVK